MTESPQKVPRNMRAYAFSNVELMLDLVYASRVGPKLDLESMFIYLTVSEATMRPLMLDASTPPEVLELVEPPEEYRGSITRLLVADRIGMPRETVRRKIQKMIDDGLLAEDTEGRIRTTRNFGQGNVQEWARLTFAAVQRYDQRLRQFGRPGVSGPKPTEEDPFP
jgi:hypothetical protein